MAPLAGALAWLRAAARSSRPHPTSAPVAAAMPSLHHHAATRLWVGTLPLLSCAVALVLRDVAGAPVDGLASARAGALCCLLAAQVGAVSLLRRGGPAAAARVAKLAALLYVLPAAAATHCALAAARRASRCGHVVVTSEALGATSCTAAALAAAERAWAEYAAPLGAPFFALSGLPPRFAPSLEAARGSLFLTVALAHVVAAACAAPASACAGVAAAAAAAARLAAKTAALNVATPIALRAALGADEPRELAHLHGLCPRRLRRVRDALMAAGAAAAAQPGLEAAAAIALLASLTHFCVIFARSLLPPPPSAAGVNGVPASPLAAAWAAAFGAALASCGALHARRAARHAVTPAAARAVHALQLHLSSLAPGAPPHAALVAAADALVQALPPGCAVALAEWTVVRLPDPQQQHPAPPATSSGSSSVGDQMSPPSQRLSSSSSETGAPALPRLEVLHVVSRGARHGAAAALRAAARRGGLPRGSAAAAIVKPAAAAGLTLDSSDFSEGAAAFADWAALCADPRAGAGTVSTALLGSGSDVCGGLWVHAPAGCGAPAPAALRAYAEAVGAVLLRNAAHAAAVRAAAAAARADADATLALQRAFLSGVTHELRTPLNAVVGFTAAVLEGAALAPRDAEYLRCSLSSANSLLAIIDQLLDYAKWGQADAAAGSAALAAAPLRLCTVLDDLVDVLGGRAAAAGVQLLIEPKPRAAAAALLGDAPRLRQVLVNLVDNALKHTPRGGSVTLTADACSAPRRDAVFVLYDGDDASSVSSELHTATASSSSTKGGDEPLASPWRGASFDGADASPLPPLPIWLRITVADTGMGIAAEDHWRLFRPFSQVPSEPGGSGGGAKPPGTGLGLVISRAIVRSMGGDIGFTSALGAGTTFRVMVPFAVDAGVPEAVDADAMALDGVALLPLLRDEALAGTLTRVASLWGARAVALPPPSAAEPGAAAESQSAEAARLRACVAAAAGGDAPWRVLLVLADAPALCALRGPGAPPMPPRAACVLVAPVAEQAGWASLGASPLDLPTSPGRLLARLRAVAAIAVAGDDEHESASPSARAAAERSTSPALVAPPSPPRSALRVLLAEDNPMNAAVARAVLARCGVSSPRVVVDGAEAVAAFQEAVPPRPPWSVILLDMRMPRMSGPDACRAIRQLEALADADAPRTHIVAVTANSSEDDRRECLEAGMDGFLVKPITPAAMRTLLGRIAAAGSD